METGLEGNIFALSYRDFGCLPTHSWMAIFWQYLDPLGSLSRALFQRSRPTCERGRLWDHSIPFLQGLAGPQIGRSNYIGIANTSVCIVSPVWFWWTAAPFILLYTPNTVGTALARGPTKNQQHPTSDFGSRLCKRFHVAVLASQPLLAAFLALHIPTTRGLAIMRETHSVSVSKMVALQSTPWYSPAASLATAFRLNFIIMNQLTLLFLSLPRSLMTHHQC
jgi:hypothetical protein